MTPTFNYTKDPEQGNSESVVISIKERGPEDKTPEVKVKKKRKKVGSSLGWGWFQGFNLFINACFLLVLIILAYYIVGSDDRHEGLPKYILDRSNDMGMVMINPNLPADIQKSFIYVPPKKRPAEDRKPELGEIKLASTVSAESMDLIDDEDLPKIELMAQPEGNEQPLGEPFGLSMESLRLDSVSDYNDSPVNFEEINHLNNIAREAMLNGHFITPYEGSALQAYQQILALAPNHQMGLSGIAELATIYLHRAEASINMRNFTEALKNVELGLTANPNHVKLNELKSEITEYLK